MGPVVCVVSDMWRVSGRWGSVVCGDKWDAGSVVYWASAMKGQWYGIFQVSGILGVSGIFEVSSM